MIQHSDTHSRSDTDEAATGSVLPISADMVSSASTSFSETRLCDGSLYWLERRPQEAGRTTIIRNTDGRSTEILPAAFDCRSRVHEYGGGAYQVRDHTVYFINDKDQQIYRLRDEIVDQITDAEHCRFTDIQIDVHQNYLVAVCEDHSGTGLPTNSLVCIDCDSGDIFTLHNEHDFYASPRLHANGKLVWICWDFPNMPWDSSQLKLSSLTVEHALTEVRHIAGGDGVSVFQPEWHDDTLYFVSDITGWWNLYRYNAQDAQPLLPMQAEFGLPQWVFAQTTYCFVGDTMIASANHNGKHSLYNIDLETLQHRCLKLDYDHFEYLTADTDRCCMLASSSISAPCIIELNHSSELHHLYKPAEIIRPESLSIAEPLKLQSRHDDTIHAFYYPPTESNLSPASLPPLIVICHGGPTGQSSSALDIRKQFWTCRGFAILDVNYSGSTGYGRDYRLRLENQWGVRDVSDVCDAAVAVADMGLADRNRLIIKGSSAGGYTVLSALTFEDVFCAGASYYGISDLETLADDTHKFEARYLDSLVGRYPQDRDIYMSRSPVHFTEKLSCPVIFLQGDEDKVVPKEQAEKMLEALNDKNIPVAYRLYPGEQHGFRKADTIIDALESELCFYKKVFDGNSDCELDIINLPQPQ